MGDQEKQITIEDLRPGGVRRRPANLSPQIPTLANKNKLMLKAIACGILLQNNVSQMGSLATTVENRWVLLQ